MRPLVTVLAATTLISCSTEIAPVTEPSAVARLSVCHLSGAVGTPITVRDSELAAHRAHGDYATTIAVDKESTTTSDSTSFARIGDAIAQARAIRVGRSELTTAACRITIAVGPGVYEGSVALSTDPSFERLPLVIDVPDITLRGSFDIPIDTKARALGTSQFAGSGRQTVLVASPGLISVRTGNVLEKFAEPLIILNGHPAGSRGDGAVIERFVFRSGNDLPEAIVGGNAVWGMRVQRATVRRNRIEAGFAEPIEFRASTARVEQNVLIGRSGSCAFCMFGPGSYDIVGNRQGGTTGRLGILVFPAMLGPVPPGIEQYTLPPEATVAVAISNNEIRDHQEVPFGIGLRVAAIGPGAPNVVGSTSVVATGNDLSNNRFAVVVEAGFPVAGTPDAGPRGSVFLALTGNDMTSSCQAGMLVSFLSQATAVGLQSMPSLRNVTFTLQIPEQEDIYDPGDITWDHVWYAHPAGAGNALIVNRALVSSGSRVPYDGGKSCSVP